MRSTNVADISQRRVDHLSWVHEALKARLIPQLPFRTEESRVLFRILRNCLTRPAGHIATRPASMACIDAGGVGSRGMPGETVEGPFGSRWRVLNGSELIFSGSFEPVSIWHRRTPCASHSGFAEPRDGEFKCR